MRKGEWRVGRGKEWNGMERKWKELIGEERRKEWNGEEKGEICKWRGE